MKITLSSVAAMCVLSAITTSASSQPLNIDFQPLDANAADMQAGYAAESGQISNGSAGLFIGLSGQPVSYTIEGDSFQMDVFDGAGSAVSMSTRSTDPIAGTTLDDLLRDSLHDNSNLRIRFRNLDPLVVYDIKFYMHDEAPGADLVNVTYSVLSGINMIDSQTVSHSGPGNPTAVPSTVETTFSSAIGAEGFQVVQFNFGGSGTIYINGFELSVDSPCLADVNGDGMVTPTDFTAWINAFNNNLPECDQNGDGNCTPTDFTAWIANFNAGC